MIWISTPVEAAENHVDTPEKGGSVLGATHALHMRVSRTSTEVAVTASLIDLQSGRSIRELSSTYTADDPQVVTLYSMVLASVGRKEEAVFLVEKALQDHPNDETLNRFAYECLE